MLGGLTWLANGSDKRIWFNEPAGGVGAITTNGVLTTYPTPDGCTAPSAGKSGTMWLVCDNATKVGRLNIRTGVVAEFALPYGTQTRRVLDANGNMWFGDLIGTTYQIGEITNGGDVVEEYDIPGEECTIAGSAFVGLRDVTSAVILASIILTSMCASRSTTPEHSRGKANV